MEWKRQYKEILSTMLRNRTPFLRVGVLKPLPFIAAVMRLNQARNALHRVTNIPYWIEGESSLLISPLTFPAYRR